MRALGAQRLIASCLNDACRHTALIDVSGYDGDVEVPSFGNRARCGKRGDVLRECHRGGGDGGGGLCVGGGLRVGGGVGGGVGVGVAVAVAGVEPEPETEAAAAVARVGPSPRPRHRVQRPPSISNRSQLERCAE